MADEELPVIRVGDVKQAEFTVNRYVTEEGEVKREELDIELPEEEMEEIETAIADGIEQGLSDFDATPGREIPTTRKAEMETTVSESDVMSAMSSQAGTTGSEETGDDSEAAESAEEAPESEDDESPVPEDALDVGRSVAREEGITTQNWPTFQATMRDEGVTDQSQLSDIWQELKDEGVITSSSGDSDSGEDDAEGEEAEEESDTSDDPEDGDDTGGMESIDADTGSSGVSLSDISGDVPVDDIEQAYLYIKGGADSAVEARDQFEPYIDAGIVQTVDKYASPAAQDIKRGTEGDIGTPSLVFDMGGGDFEVLAVGSGGSSDDTGDMEPFTMDGVEIEPGTDILVGREGHEATQAAAQILTEAFVEEEAAYATIGDDFGAAILESLDDPPDVPFGAVWTGQTFETQPLEELFEKHR